MSHKIGDRVRVTVEGEVSYASGGYTNVSTDKGTHTLVAKAATIEVLPPPVTEFGPGDTVRSKGAPSLVYSLGHDGYFSHRHSQWRPWERFESDRSVFTSRSYERVEL